MTPREKVKNLCDQMAQVKPSQMIADLVHHDVEELLKINKVAPHQIGAVLYKLGNLMLIYNPALETDIKYLTDLRQALLDWIADIYSS